MAFELPPLPYAYDALEPTISKETMTFHHDKHHAAYTAKLNEGVAADPKLEGKTIEEILGVMSSQPPLVRNNGGGFWNHAFFWRIMAPASTTQPSGKLAAAIDAAFGDFEKFKEAFNAAGAGRFGSGWVWLVNEGGKLAITSTPNQDNPLMEGKPAPLLGNDVWEHAYYLKYQNRRPDYLKAWWNTVNWNEVGKRYNG